MKKSPGKFRKNIFKKLLQKSYKKSLNSYMIGIGIVIIIFISILSVNNISAFPSYSSYCSSCHPNDMPTTWISVTVDSQTPNDITYNVIGSDIHGDNEGWAVFDPSQTNIDNGYDTGYFTLPKDGLTYPVFWVDSGSGLGGTAVEYVTTPEVNNSTPDTPIINGPTNGQAGTEYTYTFVSTDPDGDDLYYCIDWGDNTPEVCIGPFPSGEEQSDSHIWTEKNTYTVRIKARDSNDAESGYGTLDVTMPLLKLFNSNFLNWFFIRFPNTFPILQLILGLQN